MKLSHLDRLSGISGISGDESAVAEAIIRKIDGYAKWERDSVGTLFVYKEGKERRHGSGQRQRPIYPNHPAV